MPVWDLKKLQQTLDKKNPGSLFLVYGDEPFLVKEALSVLLDHESWGPARDFNHDVFYAPETSASDVRDTVEMLPMMSGKRLVAYKNVDDLKDKDWEALMPVLEEPVETTTLVLVANKIDKRKKYYKKIYDSGVIVELRTPFENQIPMWIEYIALRSGLKLDRDVDRLIMQFVGVNLREIENELLKLKSFISPRLVVSADDVLQVVSKTRVESIFDLANAIGRGDRVSALTYLAHLLDDGQNEVAALAMISRHVRILSVINEGIKAGETGPKLSARAGIPNFFLKEYLGQARSWSEKKISATLQALYETDRALKSSTVPGHIWLENFILRTCS